MDLNTPPSAAQLWRAMVWFRDQLARPDLPNRDEYQTAWWCVSDVEARHAHIDADVSGDYSDPGDEA